MTRTTIALLMAAGLAASPATAQDTIGVGAGDAATRSPATTPGDTPPVTNRGVVGNEVPGRGILPGGSGPGTGAMMKRPARGFPSRCRPTPASTRIFAAAAASSNLSEVAMARVALRGAPAPTRWRSSSPRR